MRFIDETSVSIDTLLVHEINDKGEIVNVKVVFPGVNKPGDPRAPLNTRPGHRGIARCCPGRHAARLRAGQRRV